MRQLLPLKLQSSQVDVRLPPPSSPPMRPLPAIPQAAPNFLKREISASQLPHTGMEWRLALDEVRTMYFKRHYRQCSSRCLQLLEDATDSLLPLHSVYLSFCAATSLELTARPMPSSSPQKICLFELARVNFQRAEYFLCEARFNPLSSNKEHMTTGSLKAHQRFTSTASQTSLTTCLSSIQSVKDSRPSTRSSSPMHSPASSISSVSSSYQDQLRDSSKPRPLRVKKKVSFSLTLPTVISESSISACSRQDASQTPSPIFQPPSISSCPIEHDNISHFLLSRSITRYNAHLSSLATQLTYHISILDTLISDLQTCPKTPNLFTPTPFLAICEENFHSPTAKSAIDAERGAKSAHRERRITELKRRGEEWKARRGRWARFDPSRTEELCESVLRELGEV